MLGLSSPLSKRDNKPYFSSASDYVHNIQNWIDGKNNCQHEVIYNNNPGLTQPSRTTLEVGGSISDKDTWYSRYLILVRGKI